MYEITKLPASAHKKWNKFGKQVKNEKGNI